MLDVNTETKRKAFKIPCEREDWFEQNLWKSLSFGFSFALKYDQNRRHAPYQNTRRATAFAKTDAILLDKVRHAHRGNLTTLHVDTVLSPWPRTSIAGVSSARRRDQVVPRRWRRFGHLDELDQKLWLALSCPTRGSNSTCRTLDLIRTRSRRHIRPARC